MSTEPARPAAAGGVHVHEALLGRWSVGVALLVVLGAMVGAGLLPPERIGVELCWLRALSGLPCPGCGLTRSVVSLARGEVARAVWFHPFGLLVLPFSLFAASSLLWPAALRARVHAAIDRRRSAVDLAYRAVVVIFLAYGCLRALGAATGGWPLWR